MALSAMKATSASRKVTISMTRIQVAIKAFGKTDEALTNINSVKMDNSENNSELSIIF